MVSHFHMLISSLGSIYCLPLDSKESKEKFKYLRVLPIFLSNGPSVLDSLE